MTRSAIAEKMSFGARASIDLKFFANADEAAASTGARGPIRPVTFAIRPDAPRCGIAARPAVATCPARPDGRPTAAPKLGPKAAWLDLYRVFEPVNAMPLDRGKPRHHLGRGGVG